MIRLVVLALFFLLPALAYANTSLDDIFAKLEQTRGLPSGILAKICQIESGCNPSARARTSSATGMFQWLDDEWQRTTRLMHQNREECRSAPGGRCPMSLDARLNPAIAAEVTAFSLNQIKYRLGGLIQRTGADLSVGLYMGHFLGEGGARTFFTAYAADPERNAASLFPKAAASNSKVFSGRTLAGVYNFFAQKIGAAQVQSRVTGNFEDKSGRPLVDNPNLYSSSDFNPRAVVPETETELDYQTDYSKWSSPPAYDSGSARPPTPFQSPLYFPEQPPPPFIAPSNVAWDALFKTETVAPTSTPFISSSTSEYFEIAGVRTLPTSPLTLSRDLFRPGELSSSRVEREEQAGTTSPRFSENDSTFPRVETFSEYVPRSTLDALSDLLSKLRLALEGLLSLFAR